jgi:copper oxidase (laccase) domain-containing protein
LGPCCAEFKNFEEEIPERFWSYRDSKKRFDFWAISTDQLRRAGVRPERIEQSGLCTKCRTDLFFSYRGEKTTGRLAAVIGLR